MDFLNDTETKSYFDSNNIKPVEFSHFFKGNSSLGSIVEICVKMSKRLIFGSIKNRVVEYSEFEYVVSLAISCINKRPIAFKEKLRDDSTNLDCITPEMLIRGVSINTVNVIPGLYDIDTEKDYGISPGDVRLKFTKLCKVRNDLMNIYQTEFLQTLIHQAVDKKNRFNPVCHEQLSVGDIVLIKENFTKPQKFELGIVRDLQVNSLNEVTGAIVFKGSTKELLKRHSSTLIKLLSSNHAESSNNSASSTNDLEQSGLSENLRSRRKAADACIARNKELLA